MPTEQDIQRMYRALDYAADAMILFDKAGKIVYTNHAFQKHFGARIDESLPW